MALDLLHVEYIGDWDPPEVYVAASYLVARLAVEAGVCQRDKDDPHLSSKAELHAATWDVDNGLLVQDKEGQWFRLRITAERVE